MGDGSFDLVPVWTALIAYDLQGSGKTLVDQATIASFADPKRPSSTAARTLAMRWAPCGDHRMRCFFAIRALAISSTHPSAREVEIGSLERYRAP
jgi:hypothetical protein